MDWKAIKNGLIRIYKRQENCRKQRFENGN